MKLIPAKKEDRDEFGKGVLGNIQEVGVPSFEILAVTCGSDGWFNVLEIIYQINEIHH